MYYPFVRKALFQLDPERAHESAVLYFDLVYQ